MHIKTLAAAAAGIGLLAMPVLTACGANGTADTAGSTTVTLVSHDSWSVSKNVVKDFEKRSGYKVRVLKDGDAGQAVNKAILTKGHPQGDVFFGVDNTLLSRALDNGLFQPYRAKGLDTVDPAFRLDAGRNRVTPVDHGDICVNYDKAWFAKHRLTPPRTFADLAEPAYRNLLVTENAATSSPGLGFLLGSAARYGDKGDKGWQGYWKKLKDNGVKVVDGWEQAYYQEFSGSSEGRKAGGDRPLVVSYASSPPAEVIYAGKRPATAPTGVATGTCFRQTEFAGLLSGARNSKGGKAFIDFLLTREFQQDMPLNMFVYPVVKGAKVPAEFTEYGPAAEHPETMAPARIAAGRDQWVRAWTSLVLK
ncbi:thiamine ABC transporter substrate binding subunit [Streptomyces sp. NPDC090108]|uniref:thiamine ABC transporter substrate-binding protein n=1 Tax=Streptomyces sp. NPDC090108 TaxID=3365947 RepID=UPI00381581EC